MATKNVEVKNEEVKDSGLVPLFVPLGADIHEPNFITIGFNGKCYRIKKGEQVMVPEGVKEVYDLSEKQKAANRDYIRSVVG